MVKNLIRKKGYNKSLGSMNRNQRESVLNEAYSYNGKVDQYRDMRRSAPQREVDHRSASQVSRDTQVAQRQSQSVQRRDSGHAYDLQVQRAERAHDTSQLSSQQNTLNKWQQMVDNRGSVAQSDRLKHMTPTQRAKHEQQAQRQQASASRKDTAEYHQNVRNTNRQLDAQEKATVAQNAKAYGERRENVMGRRQSRLDERSMRDDLVDNYRSRGVDLNEGVVKKGIADAKAYANKVDSDMNFVNTSSGWNNLGNMEKRGYMARHITDTEATRRTWSNIGDDVINDPTKVSMGANGPKIIDSDLQGDFDKALASNRQSIINNKQSVNPGSTGTPSAGSSGNGFDFDSVNLDGTTRGGMHSFNKRSNDVRFAEANLNRALTNDDVAGSIKSRLNIDDDELRAMANDRTKRDDVFRDRLESAKSNPTMMDNMMGNKVPQIAGGALLTAGLVSSLSNNKGQQSNSALYGQSQPYY